MRIKKTIIAPVVLTLGSLSVVAGVATPIVASSAAGVVAAAPASSSGIGMGG
jgi:hypothetical protein